MAIYLDKSKIQSQGRITLGPAALRNLKLEVGDSVEIYFDESKGMLCIFPIKADASAIESKKKGM